MLSIDLSGKVALILGGSRGIGGGITETFARAGASVFFTHTDNPKYRDRLDATFRSLKEDGCDVLGVVSDACKPEEATRTVDQVLGEKGAIHVLVVNVGQNRVRPAEEKSDAEWLDMIHINLSSAFYGVRAVLPPMLDAGRGKIILIGSSVVFDGGGGAIDYASAKAGMVGMMGYLVRNYARKGIATNVIHPCVVETDLLRERYDTEEKKQGLISQVPIGRLSQPKDVAGLAAFLASEWGDFICGQDLLVDGGRTFYKG
ncbi:MAG: SDR family NAD(P)-dependent oxidoreductase [Candidatus Latescibacteria bacterium]|nr:SDR family NAD(P)-dependent oxidoreductase [Candidatus Latescibacterota bacterium]